MFLRIGIMRFPLQDKMDAYIAMLQTVFFKKFQEDTLMIQHLVIKTGEGKLAARSLGKMDPWPFARLRPGYFDQEFKYYRPFFPDNLAHGFTK